MYSRLVIFDNKITGDIEITASGIRQAYSVTSSLTDISSNGGNSVPVGEDYIATLTADNYMSLPETINVEIDGKPAVAGVDYEYARTPVKITYSNLTSSIWEYNDTTITGTGTIDVYVGDRIYFINPSGSGCTNVYVNGSLQCIDTCCLYIVGNGTIVLTNDSISGPVEAAR